MYVVGGRRYRHPRQEVTGEPNKPQNGRPKTAQNGTQKHPNPPTQAEPDEQATPVRSQFPCRELLPYNRLKEKGTTLGKARFEF